MMSMRHVRRADAATVPSHSSRLQAHAGGMGAATAAVAAQG
jgi:hypothetical protein